MSSIRGDHYNHQKKIANTKQLKFIILLIWSGVDITPFTSGFVPMFGSCWVYLLLSGQTFKLEAHLCCEFTFTKIQAKYRDVALTCWTGAYCICSFGVDMYLLSKFGSMVPTDLATTRPHLVACLRSFQGSLRTNKWPAMAHGSHGDARWCGL